MREDIILRTEEMADYVIGSRDTVRGTAEKFGVSKSTVHKDMAARLKTVDYEKYLAVRKILDFNLSERHIRGGMATKIKYAARLKQARNSLKQTVKK